MSLKRQNSFGNFCFSAKRSPHLNVGFKYLGCKHTKRQTARQLSAASEASDLCNGSGTHLEHQGKRHHRLALVLLLLPLDAPLDARCGYAFRCGESALYDSDTLGHFGCVLHLKKYFNISWFQIISNVDKEHIVILSQSKYLWLLH